MGGETNRQSLEVATLDVAKLKRYVLWLSTIHLHLDYTPHWTYVVGLHLPQNVHTNGTTVPSEKFEID